MEKEMQDQEYKRQLRESMRENEHFYSAGGRSRPDDKFI